MGGAADSTTSSCHGVVSGCGSSMMTVMSVVTGGGCSVATDIARRVVSVISIRVDARIELVGNIA
jgi:hypothetical protein